MAPARLQVSVARLQYVGHVFSGDFDAGDLIYAADVLHYDRCLCHLLLEGLIRAFHFCVGCFFRPGGTYEHRNVLACGNYMLENIPTGRQSDVANLTRFSKFDFSFFACFHLVLVRHNSRSRRKHEDKRNKNNRQGSKP